MTLLKSIRELCAGVRALPRVASIAQRDVVAMEQRAGRISEALDKLSLVRGELEAERAAHAETQKRWAEVSDNWTAACDERDDLKRELATETAARQEAERKLADVWEEGFGAGMVTQYGKSTPGGTNIDPPRNPYESLAAAEKEGGDGK